MNEDYNYFQDAEFRQSLADYERLLETGEYIEFESETLTDIAEYYAMEQRMDEANRCIRYALSFYPDSVDPQIFLSRQQMFAGNEKEAWQLCRKIADQDDREVIFLKAELNLYFNKPEPKKEGGGGGVVSSLAGLCHVCLASPLTPST